MIEDNWLRPLGPAPGAQVRLLCFPHAGASADTYLSLARALGPSVELWSVQYPGRQERSHEEQAATVSDLAAVVSRSWHALDADLPFAVFGHSMGALVAFEVARLLEGRSATGPLRVFVSGQISPELHENRRDLPADDHLLDEVRRLGGSEAVLADSALVEAMLPPLRADYQILRNYRWKRSPILRSPLTVLCGDSDPLTPIEDAERWLYQSAVPGRVRVLQGGHFFLQNRATEVAETVLADLRLMIRRSVG